MLDLGFAPWEKSQWLLECVAIENETHDVKTFHFKMASPIGNKTTPFLHRPGQFVMLRLRFGDQLISRSYTISSSPARPMLMSLTIKRDCKGLVSRFMHDVFKPKDLLSVNGPGGVFNLQQISPRAKILMLSGGSGITPLMSMLRYLYDTRQSQYQVTFLHSARTPDDIIFRQELELIVARTSTKLHFICENGAEPDMGQGFLSRQMATSYVPDILEHTIMTCGPAPYMSAVKTILGDINFDIANYHQESFSDPQLRKNPDGAEPHKLTIDEVSPLVGTPPKTSQAGNPKPSQNNSDEPVISFNTSGKEATYVPGETVLEIATRNNIAIATNCQMGLCGTCKVLCSSGEVYMDEEEGLSSEEMEQGFVLTCCGRPSGRVTVDI